MGSSQEKTFQPKLRALVVGINEFIYQSDLNGCINDANNIEAYLEKAVKKDKYDLEIKSLRDKEATREGLISAFKSHLVEPAQDKDIIFFYFSGHGGQEAAHKVFEIYEADDKLEGLVCHDSGIEGECLLADKEIRYLMSPLKDKDCHILTIFDCCHSGDITREEAEMPEKRVRPRTIPRDWKDFIFSEDPQFTSPKIFEETHIDQLIPTVNHIQFAACQDFESAFEHPIQKYGLFTNYLLKALEETGGNISYYELQRRIRNIMRVKHKKQTPCLNSPRKKHEEIFKIFLSGTIAEKPIYGEIIYHPFKRKWVMDLGGIHGLKVDADDKAASILVDLGEDQNNKSESCEARIKKVYANYCEIAFEPYANISKRESYKGYISGLLLDELKVFVKGEALGVEEFTNYVTKNKADLAKNNIFFQKEEAAANFIIQADKGGYFLFTSENRKVQLIKQVKGYNLSAVENTIEKLLHISRWFAIKKNAKPDTTIHPREPIELVVNSSLNGEKIYNSNNGSMILRTEDPDTLDEIEYSFMLKNNSPYQLYIACLYLDSLFMIEVDYLEPKVIPLMAGGSVYALNGDQVSMEVPEYIRKFNLPYEEVYFKIIASTTPFEVDMFALPQLEAPEEKVTRGVKRKNRAFGPKDMWTTQLFTFRIQNPDFKTG